MPDASALRLRRVIASLLQVFKVEEAISPDSPYARLNVSDLNVVLFLGEAGGPVTMTAIASYLGARLSTAGSIADRLVKAGLAKRQRTEENRRIVLMSLTDDGRELHQSAVHMQVKHCQAMLDVLATDKERSELLLLLTKIADAADTIRRQRQS